MPQKALVISPPGGWAAAVSANPLGLAVVNAGTSASGGGDNTMGGFAMGPVTLYDGTVIADPANTPASAADCLAGQCGWGDVAYRLWCAQNGQVGARSCADPSCGPFCPPMPVSMTAPMPSVVQTVTAQVPSPQPPQLTPQFLVDKLPSIIQPGIAVLPPACDPLTQWVSDNALLVGVGLFAGALWAWGALGKLR